MKTPLHIHFAFCLLLCIGQSQAQTYFFSVENQEYEPLQGGQSLVSEAWDDPDFSVPIGFDFEFFTSTIDELTLRGNFTYISLVDEPLDDIASLILLFGADLVDRGWLDENHLSPIRAGVSGDPGSRVFTLQWDNAGFFADISANGSSTDFVNFQLKLFEENGDIVFHFGPNQVSDPVLAFGGNSGPILGIAEDYSTVSDIVNGEIILLSSDPLDPDVNTTYENFFLESMVPENTVYRFSRETTSTSAPKYDVSVSNFYPNPTTGMIHLKAEAVDNLTSAVEVYNISGRLVRFFDTPESMYLGDLSPGIYQLRYQSASEISMERMMVMPR